MIDVKNKDLLKLAEGIKPDSKRRVLLPKQLIKEGVVYHVYANDQGQIVLDPQVTIPASEVWLYQNKEALELVRQGLADAAEGRLSEVDLKAHRRN